MYIRPDSQISSLNLYRQQQTEKVQGERPAVSRSGDAAPEGDSVSLSSEARLMAEANRTAQTSPDIRQEKVDMLKAQVQDGTYRVDNERIAQGLLREDMGLFTR